MAKIALRLYNHEIENLIEQRQVDEAAAHCIHILKTFPKHIATYRLLGKAFLERQRYGEAADIFQRVLASIPDDFITNVGMSIIREDEGNLDAAIWHMERAFEVQPSNAAVQDELRRLYGQRDGIEPPKVRLTRGALVRMYVRGNLYQQAIAEIRAALGEEPQRADLRALLARMLYLSGQKVEATELCSEVLTRYPYNYEANRTLAEILPGTSRSEDAQAYRQRINSLDPYAAFTSPDLPDPADVPDNAVMLERLDYSPSMPTSDDQPTWAASLGIDLIGEEQTHATPDWMSGAPGLPAQTGTETGEGEPEAISGEIPDWMKSAGWGESTGAFDESKASAELTEESEAELIPGEIPEWLQSMAPDQSGEATSDPAESSDDMQAFESLFTGESAPTGETPAVESTEQPADQLAGLPDWLQPEANETAEQPTGSETVPDWLKDLNPPAEDTLQFGDETAATGEPLAAQESDDTLAWLQDLGAEKGEEAAATPESELPDWLPSDIPAEEAISGETTIEQPLDLTGTPLETGEVEPTPESELPDWLRSEAPAPDITSQLAGETLGGEQPQAGWEPGEPPLEEIRTEVTSLESEPQVTAAISEEDAALAWLEGLAAKHGADEDLLFVPPDQRTETPPDWVQQAAAEQLESSAQVAGEAAQVDETTQEQTEREVVSELPDWMASETPEETTAVETSERGETPVEETIFPAEGLPDWLRDETGTDQPAAEIETSATPVDETIVPGEGLPDWLQDETGADQPVSAVDSIETTDEETIQPVEGLPDWLQEIQQAGIGDQPETTEPEAEPTASADLPDWLRDTSAELPADTAVTEPVEEPLQMGEVPGWLQQKTGGEEPAADLVSGEGLPLETVETGQPIPDWMPSAALEGEKQPEVTFTHMPGETNEQAAPETLPSEEQAAAKTQPVRIRPPQVVEETPQAFETPAVESQEIETGEATVDTGEEAAQPLAELPEWLRGGFSGDSTAPDDSDETLQAAAGEDLSEPAGELPDWLRDDAVEETPTPVETGETPVAEATTTFVPPTMSEEDAALAWLEGLAAKHGADEDLLFVPPDQRTEKPPDWVQEAVADEQAVSEARQALEQPLEELPIEAVLGPSEADLVAEAALEETIGEVTEAVEPLAESEEPQVQPLEEAQGEWQPEVTPVEAASGETEETTTALPDWLQDIVPGGEVETTAAAEEEAYSMPLPQEFTQQTAAQETVEPAGDWTRAAATSAAPGEYGRVLLEAQAALDDGSISTALERYNQLIAAGERLDEVIHDLRDALYHYPVDAAIWQTLGDAYLRGNQMQQALDAYTKAEELLR